MDVISIRRRLIGQKQSKLPSEYQKVSFIIAQGSQYIDTGYALNSDCRVQGRFNVYGSANEFRNVLAFFGSRDSNYDNTFALFNVSSRPRVYYGKIMTTYDYDYQRENNTSVVEFDINAGIATVNGVTYTFSDTLKPFASQYSALIFSVHTGNTVDNRRPRGEIVYFKIIDDNGIVVRNMIPCYRKADNKPGMYDLVNNQFYTNAGTGDFDLPS